MKPKFLQPANLLLIIGIVFGAALAIFTPFGTGFDEEAHLARVYDISGFNMLPNRGIYDSTVFPAEFRTLSYRRFLYRDQGYELFKPEAFQTRINHDSMAIDVTLSVYPPLMFFPQAVVAGIGWRVFDLPVLPVALAMRLAGLALYLLACWLTLRVLPLGRWAFLVVALLPTSLYQAATVNGDGFTNAVIFLFIGLVLDFLHISALKATRLLTWGRVAALCVVTLLLGMAKPGAVILVLLLLLIPRKVFVSRAQRFAVWAAALLAVAFHLFWLSIGFTNTEGGQGSLMFTLGSVWAQLGAFITALWGAFARSVTVLFASMAAAYGYWEGGVPLLVYLLLLAAGLAALTMEREKGVLSARNRGLMVGLLAAAWFGTLVMYAAGKFTFKDEESISIVQGRYLVAFLPLLVLALAGLLRAGERLRRLLRWFIPAGLVLALGLFFWGLYAHYYTACGPYALSRAPCRQPPYQNLEIFNPPLVALRQDTVIEQRFENTCRNLKALELRMGQGPGEVSGSLRLALVDAGGQTLASRDWAARTLLKNQMLYFPLPDELRIDKGMYTLRLEGVGGVGEVGLGIREGEVYPGKLTVAGEPVQGHLLFFYLCAPVGAGY